MAAGITVSAHLRILIAISVVAAAGCGQKPPYRVTESPQLSARELRRLGRVELNEDPASRATASSPRVWIGVPDRRAEGAVVGALFGAGAGAVIGGIAASGTTGMFAGLAVLFGAFIVGAPVGALVGAPIGVAAGTSGEGHRQASATLRQVAHTVDVAAAVRLAARNSASLAKHQAAAASSPTVGPGALLNFDVIAYGTRAAGGGRARPFVAARIRLTEVGTGRVLYDEIRDWRGPKKQFQRWAEDDGGAEFRHWLETGAATLGRQGTRRALTPRKQ